MRLLVVEDDITIAEPLRVGLERDGFEVDLVTTGTAALDAAPADLVLLDLGLPDLDGTAVCRELRARSDVPIIVVTARGDEIDRVSLLDLGADDYVVKPFGLRELTARVRAVLRRTNTSTAAQSAEGTLRIGTVTVDRRTRVVRLGDTPIDLTPKEYDLLVYLAAEQGTVHLREQIIRDVWDQNWWGSTKTLDVHIASLRRKLGSELIETIRGVGFRIPEQP